MGLSILQYTQDYDEKYVPYQTTAGGWQILIQPYSKSNQLMQCPSEGRDAGQSDYAYNLLLGWSLAADAGGSKNQAALTQPVVTVLLVDSVYSGPDNFTVGCDNTATRWDCTTPGLADFWPGAAQRHLEGQNVAFTDGHVKWYKSVGTGTRSDKIYNEETPGSTSGSSPTFRIDP
jgi:prepilin-type processing-associated H-X9-DG protein